MILIITSLFKILYYIKEVGMGVHNLKYGLLSKTAE